MKKAHMRGVDKARRQVPSPPQSGRKQPLRLAVSAQEQPAISGFVEVSSPPEADRPRELVPPAAAPQSPPANTIDQPAQMVSQALQLHRQGKFAEAEVIYRCILEAAPDHADSLQLLGALSLQLGRTDEAIGLL